MTLPYPRGFSVLWIESTVSIHECAGIAVAWLLQSLASRTRLRGSERAKRTICSLPAERFGCELVSSASVDCSGIETTPPLATICFCPMFTCLAKMAGFLRGVMVSNVRALCP